MRKRKDVPAQKKKPAASGSAAAAGGGGAKKSSGSKQQMCPPPDPSIIAYVQQMPIMDQRKNVARGLRVKVSSAGRPDT